MQHLKAEAHKQKVAAQCNSKIKHRSLQEGDLILMRILPQHRIMDRVPIWRICETTMTFLLRRG